MNPRKYWHTLDYVYWKKEAQIKRVNFSQFNDKIDDLKILGGRQISYTTKRSLYENNFFAIKTVGNNKCIYAFENGKYYIYYTNKIDDSKNTRNVAYGQEGIRYLNNRLVEEHGLKLRKAFGYTEEEFKRCIPKIFSFSNSARYNKIYMASSVDFTSHWPASARGLLPNSKGMLEYDGTVAPNEEYPFAFYLNSGHIAQYGVFDTHNWCKSAFTDALFRYSTKEEKYPHKPFLDPKEDKTVLMKASEYELGKYFEELYQLREKKNDAKMYANASIGFMHRQKYDRYKLAHLSAVIIARATQKTLDEINKIGEYFILHAVVDGFVYLGNAKLGIDEKIFGELHQEYQNCKFMMRGTNNYIVFNNEGKCINVKHSGFECRLDGSEITEDTIFDFNEFNNWKAKRGV